MMTQGFSWIHLEFEKLEPVGHRGPMALRTASCVVADSDCATTIFWGVHGAKAAFDGKKPSWSYIDESLPSIKCPKFRPQDIEALVDRLVMLATEQLSQADIVIHVPMPEAVALLATALAVDRCLKFAEDRNRQILVCLRVGMPDELTCAHGVKMSAVLRHLAARDSSNTWLITAETPGVARQLKNSLGLDVPIQPAALPALLKTKQDYFQGSLKTVRISYLGEARQEKGFQHLPKIFQSLVEEQYSFRGVVHAYSNAGNHSEVMETTCRQLRELAAQLPEASDLTLLQTAISEAGYLNTLLTTDIVLMPYDEAAYRGRGSGVLDECLGAGIQVLLTDSSELYSDYGGHPLVFPLNLLNPGESLALAIDKKIPNPASKGAAPSFWELIRDRIETLRDAGTSEKIQWQLSLGQAKDWQSVTQQLQKISPSK